MTYQQRISKATGCTADEARMVEAWMRLTFSTLDGLDRIDFAREAKRNLPMVRQHPTESDELAASYGL